MWLHNGNLISSQASSYIINPAKVEHSGEYRCQTGGSVLSDPVKLEVHQGESFQLTCRLGQFPQHSEAWPYASLASFPQDTEQAKKWGQVPPSQDALSHRLRLSHQLHSLQWAHLALSLPGNASIGPAHLPVLIPHSLGSSAGLPKAVVVLDPQWVRVLEDDSVTLKCQGSYPSGNSSTMWLHNGNLISSQASSYIIKPAKVEHSGEYRCQTGGSALSDPVKLEVHQGESVKGKREGTNKG
ncbi:PREDICTED: uncharacterized protein LOC103582791 [Galeopterus variegatus]|uniref:Uncharacterized protein LOC103582791 n=1 Tax=Galeopterus variegatus TaxID=482537 RepID=A0ABM0Q2C2_GALVR|nr:PREDICTED: uncharacterized protein LOC103582791 [Galeopterus variegatus]